MNSTYKVFLVVTAVLVCANGNPIMVYSGTSMLPIRPPIPAPRLLAPYPPIPPAPVHEYPEPENSVYTVPLKFGYRIKPLIKSYQASLNYKNIY